MDNGANGGNAGNRSEFFGAPESFEKAFEVTGGDGSGATTEVGSNSGVNLEAAQRGLGGAALGNTGVIFGDAAANGASFTEAPKFAMTPEEYLDSLPAPETGQEIAFSGVDMATGMREVQESRPLAMDGSTEGKLGKIAVDLSGGVIDKNTYKELEKSLDEFKSETGNKTGYNLNGLSNRRDKLMAESLRESFGRIFGNDAGGRQE